MDLYAYDADGNCIRLFITTRPSPYQSVPTKVVKNLEASLHHVVVAVNSLLFTIIITIIILLTKFGLELISSF